MTNDQEPRRKRLGISKGIYFLPNLITTTSLFFGFFAVCKAVQISLTSNDDYRICAIFIFISAICDALDGRVARITNTASKFGVELDSLCDMVSFGFAPAIIMYLWGLQSLGKIGFVGLFLYLACGALRLARFNVQSQSLEKNYFQGLPIPMAALILMGTILIWQGKMMRKDYFWIEDDIKWLFLGLTYLLAALMVSNIPYRSFKSAGLRRKLPLVSLVGVAGALMVMAIHPWWTLYTLGCAYVLSGPLEALLFGSKNIKLPIDSHQKEADKHLLTMIRRAPDHE